MNRSSGVRLGRNEHGGAIFGLLRWIILLGLIAATILVFRSPKYPAEISTIVPSPETALWSTLVSAFELQEPALDLSWAEVNGLIKTRVSSAEITGMRILPVEFVRAFVLPGTDRVEIVVERKLYGLSLYSSVTVRPERDSAGAFTLVVESSALGSLPIPEVMSRFVTGSVMNLLPAFEPELDVLSRASSITISPERLRVSYAK